MRTLSAVALLCLGSAFAADPAPESVAKLIEQLGSPDYQAREAASKELDALGGPALPMLQKAAASSGDAEAARRAAELAETITRRMDNDRALAPTLVELNFEDAPLATILDELRKQGGGRLAFEHAGAPDARLTVKTGGKVPYWEAVAKVCAAAGLEVAPTAAPTQSTSAYRGEEARAIAAVAERQAAMINVMMQNQARVREQLKAAQAEVAKNAVPDKKKAEELLQQQRREMELVLAQLAQMQARQAVLDRAAQPLSSPANPGVISLRPKSERPNPSCVSGAVRVEAVPFPAAALATMPRGTVPVVLHASPEPRLKWERVEAVRVTKAVDDAGRELAAAVDETTLHTRVFPVQGGAVVFGGNGVVNLLPSREPSLSHGFAPTTTQALVRLKASGAPTSLKSLEGVVRGVIRTGTEELAAAAGLDRRATVSALGANGVALTVTAIERPEGEEYEVGVTLRYDPTEVQVAGQPDIEETLRNRGRARVMIRQAAGGLGRVPGATSHFGLTVTDAAGKPLTLTAISSRRIHDPSGGEVTDLVKLLARPSEPGRGGPAKVSFAGTRTKVVEVPFKLSDVPVAVGTAEVPDELKKPAGR